MFGGIVARDLKVELGDQKQVDSDGATPVSSDAPYIAGYRITQPNYIASYITKEHSHVSHHETDQPSYLAGYRPTTHDSNEPYIAAYRTANDAYEANQPNYIASYITKERSHVSHHETNQPNYIAGYRTAGGAHEANQPNYIYRTSTQDSNENEPYITGYRTTEANKYLAGYRTSTHEAKQPYIAGYNAHDSNQQVSDVKKAPKESAHDATKPYITQYGGNGPKNNPKESASAHDYSTKPYVTQHGGLSPKKDSKESTTQDSGEPYITQYGRSRTGSKKESTSAQDSTKPYVTQYGDLRLKKEAGEPYITQYGDNSPKHDPEVSTQGYEATYQKKSRESKHFFMNRKSEQDSEDSNGPPSPIEDHIEAFKTGFFTLDDLHVGNVMTLQFPIQEISHFLSRKEADSIPFSMSQLPSVLQLFSIPQDSPQAKSMRGTLEQCEAEPITGETKFCANSLESMLDFVDKIIGSEDVKYNILTTSHPSTSAIPLQKYTILEVSQDIDAPKWVACHPLPYPYAVYYCHFIATGSKVFKVSLGGENGDNMEALGICHLDTSDWSPDHILFKQLGIKPGKAPVCHYFPVKHLMWVPQPSKATM
ncbi:BURP domain [Sesbania bispinosa]|nr:BURP domain [Sesbania bispinosa]